MVNEARRLGLNWELTMGTVVDGAALQVLCDGDSETITVVSCIGDLITNTRVYVIQVPPSGNFVMGSIPLIAPGRGLVGLAGRFTGGLIAQSTGTTEVAVPSGSWTREPRLIIGGGRIVRVDVYCGVFINAATNTMTVIRIRKGSASITGVVAFSSFVCVNAVVSTAGNPQSIEVSGYFKNPDPLEFVTPLSLTQQRVTGAAVVDLFGNAGIPMLVTMTDVGAIRDHASLAAIATDVS